MVELVRAGCEPEELARQFEPSAPAVRNSARRTDLDTGQLLRLYGEVCLYRLYATERG